MVGPIEQAIFFFAVYVILFDVKGNSLNFLSNTSWGLYYQA